jgi:hypothetical protein
MGMRKGRGGQNKECHQEQKESLCHFISFHAGWEKLDCVMHSNSLYGIDHTSM